MIITPSSTQAESSTSYRIKRGTKLADVQPHPPLPLTSFNGPFQLAEYLSLKVKHDPHDVDALVAIPTVGDGAGEGGKSPERDVWIYEHLRRLPIDLTPLLTALLPICTRESCPQMKADEWLYLCVAHGGGGTEECCAIDYILHTLDSTTALLNSSKSFPSRLSIPPPSLSHFPSLFRRLSRIFSHAHFHHPEAFALAESETSLYARFVGLCERYELVGKGLLVVPESAYRSSAAGEGHEDEDDGFTRGGTGAAVERSGSMVPPPSIASAKSRPEDIATSVHDSDEPPPTALKFGSGKGGTLGRGTLGRGKQKRGTMLWQSDAEQAVPEEEGQEEGVGGGGGGLAGDLERTESRETAIYEGSVGEEPSELAEEIEETLGGVTTPGEAEEPEQVEDTQQAQAQVEEAEPVPKDEIELLEEEGAIPKEEAVAPLVTPAENEVTPAENKITPAENKVEDREEVKGVDEEVLEEVHLHEEGDGDEAEDAKGKVELLTEEGGVGEVGDKETSALASAASASEGA